MAMLLESVCPFFWGQIEVFGSGGRKEGSKQTSLEVLPGVLEFYGFLCEDTSAPSALPGI